MAVIKPLRAWRYAPSLQQNIEELTAPLFDVVSDKEREKLYTNPYNSIHLSLPQGQHAAENAKKLLDEWKTKGVIQQDVIPAIYVYYQYFRVEGSSKEHCTKGFVCHIRAYDWNENIILRHENTIPKAVNDRAELLAKTELHASPTLGLYTDTTLELERYMDEAIQMPIYETEDYQGVRDVFAVIHDAKIIQRFIDVVAPQKIILADGHHRYEASLKLKHQRENNGRSTGNEGYLFHLMYLTNTESSDLRILPTHRLLNGIADFNEHDFVNQLSAYFDVKTIDNPTSLNEIIVGKKWTFGVLLKNRALKIRLKPEAISEMTWHFPNEIKNLDLTVLHYFIIEKILNILGKDQRSSDCISFERSFALCIEQVNRGDKQLAIITQGVSIEEIKQVCASGYTMPQKSTYFYPKVISGFLFSSIKEDEFQTPSYSRF